MEKNSENFVEFYNNITNSLGNKYLSASKLSKPDPTIEEEAVKIYTQARRHRGLLVWFYIIYTFLFTAFVLSIILLQAVKRIELQDSDFELIPHWALSILIAGIFAQFVGLLTIITKRVWDFKELLGHHVNGKGTLK